jgi:hypothetical protein
MQGGNIAAAQAALGTDALEHVAVEAEQSVLSAYVDETVVILDKAVVFQAAKSLELGERRQADGLAICMPRHGQHEEPRHKHADATPVVFPGKKSARPAL